MILALSLLILSIIPGLTYSADKDSASTHIAANHPSPDTSDILANPDSNALQKRLSAEEFIYADTRLHTLNGSLPYETTKLKTVPSLIVGGFYAGIFYLQHDLQMNTIWEEQGDFKFFEDGKYALYSDKAGHFFGTYFTSYIVRETMLYTGMSWEMSNIVSTFIGLGYSTYIEVLDGYGENWGFSPSDFYFDVAGAGFYLGQHFIPFLQNFTPKFMYIPAEWHGEHGRKEAEFFIDNYGNHTLWLSVNVENMLPESAKDYWPDWLELSFGYAARNQCTPGSGCEDWKGEPHYNEHGDVFVYGDQKYILALDYNLVKMLPDDGYFWNWLRQTLNFFKLPSPAVEFGDKTRFYLVYPFKF